MLKKLNRISKRKEFESLKKNGRRVLESPFFGVVVEDRKDDVVKFGMIISKKISKRAVDRNKIRRRLMEVLGKRLDKFEKGLRVLFLVKRNILDAEMINLEREVDRLISKL